MRYVRLVVVLVGALGCQGGGSISQVGGTGAEVAVPEAGATLPPVVWPDAGAMDAAAGPEVAACAATSARAEPAPVDVFIMLDKSGSMAGAKWQAARAALTEFVASPATAGLGVGLGLFPFTTGVGVLAAESSCFVADYARPVVGIEPLPGVGPRIVDVMTKTPPAGGTPTSPALAGALQYAREWETTRKRRIAIALVTDGVPNDCQSTVMGVSGLAQEGAAKGIFTFVVGVGPDLQSLDAIAMAGGTGAVYLVDGGRADQLIDALLAIQNQATRLACRFTIPPAPPGRMLDPDRVNVQFSATGDPTMATSWPRVTGAAGCGAAGAWYYDDPAAPTTVNLCDAACAVANAAPKGELDVLFGCKTVEIR